MTGQGMRAFFKAVNEAKEEWETYVLLLFSTHQS